MGCKLMMHDGILTCWNPNFRGLMIDCKVVTTASELVIIYFITFTTCSSQNWLGKVQASIR